MPTKYILGAVAAILMSVGSLHAADAPATTATPAKPYYLVPSALGSWWTMGETVTYRNGGGPAPADMTALQGTITNADGDGVATVTTPLAEVESQGWTWKPAAPGFYEVEFKYVTTDGNKKELARYFEIKAPAAADKEKFKRTRQGFAVVATAQPVLEKAVGQFGLANDHPTVEDVELAKKIGFDLVRLTVSWGAMFTNLKAAIEPVKGEYHWEHFDNCVDLYTKAGFVINAQFLYTPVWASPFPETVDKINICVREANAYAPKDLNDFSTFVATTVTRYKDRICLWEIWNEPSIPGGSCFWSDTTENYVGMLKTGYTTIKKIQPDSQVWIGGLGPRAPYHAFYNKVLALGGGAYFDVLSLHGSFNSPNDRFRDIEKANHVAPKPAIQGEWHAILQGNSQSAPPLAEQALSMKMMKDMIYQLKNGVSRIIMFELKNLVEKEVLEYAGKNKWFVHSSGLFRRQPQVEPRQPAVVLANFLNLTRHQATFAKELKLADNAIAVALTTGNGPLIAFWGESVEPPLAAVKAWATPASVLKDWEGRDVPLDGKTSLVANRLYYLTAPSADAIAKTPEADNLLSPRAKERRSITVPKGQWVKAPLFSSINAAPNVSDKAWLTSDWKATFFPGAPKDDSYTARAAVGGTETALDIVVEVKDKVHVQKEPAPAFWNADSLQLAIDCEGNGFPGGNTEFVSALTANGPATWKILAADPKGDIPQKWSASNTPAKFIEQHITHENGTTRYQLRIPWSELYPLVYDPSRPLRIAIAINNSNGSGRAGYLEWGGGITTDKDPSRYGVLQAIEAR